MQQSLISDAYTFSQVHKIRKIRINKMTFSQLSTVIFCNSDK